MPGTVVPNGAKVPGTQFQLDPVQAAFNIGAMIRWLDFNDTWLAAEWGHPSDNLGGILAVADWLSRTAVAAGKQPLTMRDVLTAMIKAHEIQGVLALENSFNRVGLDHVVLVKVASTAVVTRMLGGTREEVINAVSQAWVDGQSLRTYRHAPNTGSRKSWAAGDATSRAVRLALITLKGEMGYPSVLSAKTWGFYDVLFKGNAVQVPAALRLLCDGARAVQDLVPGGIPRADRGRMRDGALPRRATDRLDQIDKIVIRTHESAIRIIDKKGPLNNPADRDHCMQYMVAVPLDSRAPDRRRLRGRYRARSRASTACATRWSVVEDKQFSKDYLDPEKRSIANAIQIVFKDGSKTEDKVVEYPIGHRRRRAEGIPVLEAKFKTNLARRFASEIAGDSIVEVCQDQKRLEAMPVHEFVDLFVI